ncbi:MAG: RDD family protein [Gammaproteobacteria bacterium]|nr:RDD family protein [Gammaproteobacteria bacterium]
MLDTVRSIETPEGIELALQVAGPLPRFLAWLMDVLGRLVIYWILQVSAVYLGGFGSGLFLIVFFLLEWFYPVLFELYWHGQTPGKRLMGLRVVNDDGTPIRASASVIRNLVRFVDFLPFMYGFGIVSSMFHPDFKRLGDLSAATVVIYADKEDEANLPSGTAPQAPPWPLAPHEQKTIIDFAERRKQLTPQRANELAMSAGVLIAGLSAKEAQIESAVEPADLLQAYATWIVGEHH